MIVLEKRDHFTVKLFFQYKQIKVDTHDMNNGATKNFSAEPTNKVNHCLEETMRPSLHGLPVYYS